MFGRTGDQERFKSIGLSATPTFLDYTIYNGMNAEYYVEAIYDQGQSQPSNMITGSGGQKLASNEFAWDTGFFGYSYYGYPGLGVANYFGFDCSLAIEAVKVHIEHPGAYTVRVYDWLDDNSLQVLWSVNYSADARGWYVFPVEGGFVTSGYLVEFAFGDSTVQVSYDPADNGIAFVHDPDGWGNLPATPMIRITGDFTTVGLDNQSDIPATFALQQNYPNPFNPVTTIPYQLPEQSKVSISVYDIRGIKVATLVNGAQEPGYYQISWDGIKSAGRQVPECIF